MIQFTTNPPVVADHPEDDELDLVPVVEAVPCFLFQASKISENRDSCHLFSQKSNVHTYTHMCIYIYVHKYLYIYICIYVCKKCINILTYKYTYIYTYVYIYILYLCFVTVQWSSASSNTCLALRICNLHHLFLRILCLLESFPMLPNEVTGETA